MKNNIFKNIDYIKFLGEIERESVDFICIDPPYGKIDGMQLSGQTEAIDWDIKIDWKIMFELFNKVLKKGGTMAVFGQNPTYSEMILSNLSQYKYEYVWTKNNAAQGFHANKMPLVYTENIAVFIKEGGQRTFNKPNTQIEVDKETHFTRWYAQKIYNFIGKKRREIHKELGHRKLEFFFTYNGKHFGLLSEELYNQLIDKYSINTSRDFIDFIELKKRWEKEKPFSKGVALDASLYVGTFSNILNFPKDYKPYFHPTQKPINLLKKLIEIYSNQGDVILDCFAGSGSTLLAAKELGRYYLGSEILEKYYKIALDRLNFII